MKLKILSQITKFAFSAVVIANAFISDADAQTVDILKEVEIGASGKHYLDPEFDPDTFRVAFTSGSDVYLGTLDPLTGRFLNHDYQFVDSSAPIYLTLNGPEWGSSKAGTGIYYTKRDTTGHFHNFRYLNGEIKQLDRGRFNLLANYPSKNSADESALVMGALFPDSAKGFTFGVLSEDNPSIVKRFPIASIGKGPRFVIDERKTVTNLVDKNGVTQMAIFDFDSGKITQSTYDEDHKDSGFSFLAPELNNEKILVGVVNRGKAVRAYRKLNGQWKRYAEIQMNSNIACNLQAFSYKGKTFFSFNRPSPKLKNSNDIVISSMDGGTSFVVSNEETALLRFDPETLVSGEHLFVYYYDLLSARLFLTDVLMH